MANVDKLIEQMQQNPKHVRFSDLEKVCTSTFGIPRQSGSHMVYKTPWFGDPRVNIQNDKGMAKIYQVRQVLKAIERIKYEKHKP